MSDPVTRLNAALEGRYAIERELGEGGMATVYLADDLKHERKVALKVLKPELAAVVGAERFLAEIKTTANLQHPHILPLHDSGEADGFLFYVMPFVEGETLRDRLDREHQLPVDEAVRITTDLAEALDYAHRHKIIHRDIKPANILMHEGRPLIADFGIALAIGAAGGGRLTETGLSLGTPFYMSPEQATGEQFVGSATDTYALGVVLYEMLTGDPPYMGSTAQVVLGQIIAGEAASATKKRGSVPVNVDAALRCALEKLPADRFTSAQEFVRALGDEHFRYGELATAGAAVGPWKRLTVAMTTLAAVATLVAAWSLLRPEASNGVLRYTLMVPEELALQNNYGPSLALSRDGHTLAFQSTSDGGLALWVKERDRVEATRVSGTDGAFQPFFSPEGDRVAFITDDRRIRVASLVGEPPLTVLDSGTVRAGGTWATDGFIYFSEGTSLGNPTGGLARVPASGGDLEPVTSLDTLRAELSHAWPAVLPSGRGVLFRISRERLYDPETMDIAVADLRTGEHRVLLQGVMALWAETGHILVLTADGTLLAAPFDQEALVLLGPPVPVLEGIELELSSQSGLPASADLAISETGTLVYAAGDATQELGQWQPVWVTREGAEQEIDPGWREDIRFPAPSPDGSRLAVNITQAGESQVWIKQLDQGPLSKFTFSQGVNSRPAWTPDGLTVAFVSSRGEAPDLFARRADGSALARPLLEQDGSLNEVVYSPDGEWLLYRLGQDLYARGVGSDGEPVVLANTPAFEGHPAVSPDGRWLAYTSSESGQREVYVHPFPNTGDARWLVSSGGEEPVWAHSGRELFFRSLDQQLMAVEVLPGTTFVEGETRSLFPLVGYRSSGTHQYYDVAPDDDRFVFVRRVAGSRRLIVVENFFEELKRLVPN